MGAWGGQRSRIPGFCVARDTPVTPPDAVTSAPPSEGGLTAPYRVQLIGHTMCSCRSLWSSLVYMHSRGAHHHPAPHHPMLGSSMRRRRSAGTPALPALLPVGLLALAGLAAGQRWPQAPAARTSTVAAPVSQPPTATALRSPSASSAPTTAPSAPAAPPGFSFRNNAAPEPNNAATGCGFVSVTAHSCTFFASKGNQAEVILSYPVTRSMSPLSHSTTALIGLNGNPLRTLLQRTFAANPAKPSNYLDAPSATVTVTTTNGATVAGTSRLVPSRQKSVRSAKGKYRVYFQRGAGFDDLTRFPRGGQCSVVIPTPCPSAAPPPAGSCPQGQLDFNDGEGCVAVCKPGQVDVGDGNGCVAPAAECQGSCITDFAGTFDNAGTCAAL